MDSFFLHRLSKTLKEHFILAFGSFEYIVPEHKRVARDIVQQRRERDFANLFEFRVQLPAPILPWEAMPGVLVSLVIISIAPPKKKEKRKKERKKEKDRGQYLEVHNSNILNPSLPVAQLVSV